MVKFYNDNVVQAVTFAYVAHRLFMYLICSSLLNENCYYLRTSDLIALQRVNSQALGIRTAGLYTFKKNITKQVVRSYHIIIISNL